MNLSPLSKLFLFITVAIVTAFAFVFLIAYVLIEFALITLWKELYCAMKFSFIGFWGEAKKTFAKIND